MYTINDINSILKENTLPVVPIVADSPAGFNSGWHTDCRGQLIGVHSGVLDVTTESGTWIVSPQKAVWVPINHLHKVESFRNAKRCCLFIDDQVSSALPDQCSIIQISPLIRELHNTFLNLEQPYDKDGADGRLLQVLIDQLSTSSESPLNLPDTDEPRLKKILDFYRQNPSDTQTIQQWADTLGVSVSTLTRMFKHELNMSFTTCRQHIRLLAAVRKLAEGNSIASVAQEVGFQSQSSFTALFRRVYGVTPKRYLPL